MEKGLYQQLSEIQETHWWQEGRREMVRALLNHLHVSKKHRGLDIGCGVGGNLKLIQEYCDHVVGFDYSSVALSIAKEKYSLFHFIKGDANHLSDYFKSQTFGLVTVFNVLYHQWVTNDVNVLKQINSVLSPQGVLVITEPAFQCLRRKHDDLSMGKTRYSLKELKSMIEEAGFVVDYATYFNAMMFLPVVMLKILESIFPPKPHTEGERVKEIELPPVWLNYLLLGVFKMEIMLIKLFGKLPFGVSCLCIAHKP